MEYQHIYLSPHYDDASLSCGGAIQQQTQAGQAVLVVTLCAAVPKLEAPLSPLAQALHQRWGNPGNAVVTRQTEDQAAMKILGADYQWLPFTDCIYRGDPEQRGWYYPNEADIFGQIHPADTALSTEIVQALTKLASQVTHPTFYAPLGVGHHVDHQLVHVAAWDLYQQGWTVAFYEDYPYTDPDYPFTRHGQNNPYTLAVTLANGLVYLKPEVRHFAAENLRLKIESVRAYASQLQILFGGATEMEKRLQQYALSLGEGQPAERVWWPPRIEI